MERKMLWAGFGLLAIVLAAAISRTLFTQKEFNGVEISPPPSAPVLPPLVNQANRVTDSGDFANKVVLLFFGYTNCPDECPATLAKLRTVFSDLPDAERSNVKVIFVTTDPNRDTPERLASYLKNFNSDFIGLTGTASDLRKIWNDYGVTVLDDGATHSTRVYVIDKEGKLRLTFPAEMTPYEMFDDVRQLLQEQ